MKPVGILALQGAFHEHAAVFRTLGVDTVLLRQAKHFRPDALCGLVLPGGESTVMGRLLVDLDLRAPLVESIKGGLPTFCTCAGLLLLAKRIINDPLVHLGTMDIVARRNAYGRQLGSFAVRENFRGLGSFPMTFIRAPWIESVGENVDVLGRVQGRIVAARDRHMLATAFHPELTDDSRVHQFFLSMCCAERPTAQSATLFSQQLQSEIQPA